MAQGYLTYVLENADIFWAKERFTLAQAAEELSKYFNREIKQSDILELALSEKLEFSIEFIHLTPALRVDDKGKILGDSIENLSGVYDLEMSGLTKNLIKSMYQQLIKGPKYSGFGFFNNVIV